ncbi:hypothetical protein [Microbacterium sp. ZW T5_56]|uniref:hypothetical protein n=1 Tax=Microbacterium sp. ZW T5_56 TaxID=3378081 RepID=UPI003854CD0A
MALTQEQAAARLAELATPHSRGRGSRTKPEWSAEAVNLAALRNLDTHAFADAPQAEEHPSFFLKDASPATRDRLLALLKDPDATAGKTLHALAFIGGDAVAARFRAWEQDPPRWREQLHVGPEVYALQADWEPATDGSQHDLTFPSAVVFRRSEASPVGDSIGGRADGRCPRCEGALINAVTIDGANPRYHAFGLTGVVSVPACPWCAMFAGTTGDGIQDWVRYEADGSSRIELGHADVPERHDSAPALRATWAPAAEHASGSTSLWRTHADCDEVPVLGGHPLWLQDAEYMHCPDCDRRMRHLAWIPLSCLSEEGEEGIWYVQICGEDRVAVVLFQQT